MRTSTRRIITWSVISIAIHGALLYIPMRKPLETLTTVSTGPMTVNIVEAESKPAEAQVAEPKPTPPTPPPRPRPPVAPPRIIAREVPKSTEKVPLPEPTPPPPDTPPRPIKEPPMDMLAALDARRAARQAAESAMARGPHNPTAAELAEANIARNLQFNPGDGTGGVFQILSKGTRTAEFAFNGWQPGRDRKWREVIEVDAGLGGDVDRAIVKRMIELIRGHYPGDFRWESRYLGRVVTLSARPEDSDGLEDFLMREFFGTPVVKGVTGR